MTSEILIGIDVAKDELVIDSAFEVLALANTPEAIDAWLKTLPAGSYIGLEATSDYHQPMAEQAVLMGMVVYVLNPRDMRHYALRIYAPEGMNGKCLIPFVASLSNHGRNRFVQRFHKSQCL